MNLQSHTCHICGKPANFATTDEGMNAVHPKYAKWYCSTHWHVSKAGQKANLGAAISTLQDGDLDYA